MSAWWDIAAARAARGDASVLVTVATVEGSAPREAGAKMLVWDGGQDGTVGGGKLEYTIVEQAHRLLAAHLPWRFQHYPLGPLLGQCCGGRVGILLERLDQQSAGWLGDLARAEAAGTSYALLTKLEATGVVKRISASTVQGPAISVEGVPPGPFAARIGEGLTITERLQPRPCLMLFGAGHVGQALYPIVATLPFATHWLDTRPDFAATGADIAEDLEMRARQAPPGSFYLIFTQSHELDYRLVRAVLTRGDFAYCGLIGSATKRTRFEKRLLADGITRAALARLTCPIGAIGLSSKLPQSMAVAIAAELLLVRERAGAMLAQRAAHGG